MKTLENTTESLNVNESVPSVSSAPASDAPAKPAKVAPVLVKILGNRINLAELERVVNAAESNAGRMVKIAEGLNLGKSIATLDGGSAKVVTPAVLAQLKKLGKLGDNQSKAKQLEDQVKGLNALANALELLGLASRSQR